MFSPIPVSIKFYFNKHFFQGSGKFILMEYPHNLYSQDIFHLRQKWPQHKFKSLTHMFYMLPGSYMIVPHPPLLNAMRGRYTNTHCLIKPFSSMAASQKEVFYNTVL